jgi:Mrp family chromosome partitioning ATPase
MRQWFDVIIIDTGPALGSLEASVAAMVSDQVVMTVTRGENRANLQRSIELISATGADLAGIVLNRASTPDMLTSNFSSSISRRSSNGSSTYVLPERLPTIEHKNLRLGPIGTAVAAMSQVAYEDETLN